MELQRRMLDGLGVDGMSSDEEERFEGSIQYRILVPRWRSQILIPWLRMFDILHQHYRLEDNSKDMRGALPQRRVPGSSWSASRRFVPGLPMNVYRTEWLEGQLDIPNVVHPAPPAAYLHDPQLAE
jgi:hypothetical protein